MSTISWSSLDGGQITKDYSQWRGQLDGAIVADEALEHVQLMFAF